MYIFQNLDRESDPTLDLEFLSDHSDEPCKPIMAKDENLDTKSKDGRKVDLRTLMMWRDKLKVINHTDEKLKHIVSKREYPDIK